MSAPTEEAALAAMRKVQQLSGPQIEKAINEEIGDPMMAVFSMLVRHLDPFASEDQVSRRIHLMVLAYLMRNEINSKP
jgi:hypothetical protein